MNNWVYFYCALLGLPLLNGDVANAGAWGKQRGEIEIIIDSFVLDNSEITDKGAFELYSENGLGRGFSFVNEANVQLQAEKALSTLSVHSFKYARGFKDNWSAGIMLGVDAKIADIETETLELGPTARIMLGRGFKNGIWINGEIGARNRNEETSYFGELGLGKRFTNRDLLIVKYMTEGGYLSNFGSNVQISYVKAINRNWKLDFGYRKAIGNNGRTRNSGFVVGVWWQK